MLLAVSMVVMAAGCGGGASRESDSAEPETQQSASEAVEQVLSEAQEGASEYVPTYPIVDEPITVTGLVVGRDTSVSDSRIVWDKVSEITGINIEWINIDEESLSTYLAGNDWPDFFHTDNLTTSQINDYGIVGGRFVNYLDYLDIMPNLAKTYKDYPETLATSMQLNGEVYNLFTVNGKSSTSTS